jgi:hypothetical protein
MRARVEVVFTLDEIRDLYPESYERAIDSLRERRDWTFDPDYTTEYAQEWLADTFGGELSIDSWDVDRGAFVGMSGYVSPGAVRSRLTALLEAYPDWTFVAEALAALPPTVDWDQEEWFLYARYDRYGTHWNAEDLVSWYGDEGIDDEVLGARCDAWEAWGEWLAAEVLSVIRADVESWSSDEAVIEDAEINEWMFHSDGRLA